MQMEINSRIEVTPLVLLFALGILVGSLVTVTLGL